MHGLTIEELSKFGFPAEGTDLVTLTIEDRLDFTFTKAIEDVRLGTFSSAVNTYQVVRVVDDPPIFFPICQNLGAKDRMGFLRPKRFKLHEYLEKGATRVVDS